MTYSTAADAPIGTWQSVNIETSHPELPHPQSMLTTFSSKDDGMDYVGEVVWTDGRSTTSTAFFKLDGNWYPVTGSMMFDSLSARQSPSGEFHGQFRKGNTTVGTQRAGVSEDGQTMTAEWNLTGPGGTTIIWNTVSTRK